MKIAAVCSRIKMPVVLLGGPEDRDTGNWIVKNAGDHVQNACGKLLILQSASVVKQSKRLITHDTGLMHIGAALKKEVISVWGNTVPLFGMYPYYGDQKIKSIQFEVEGLKCRPCSKLGYEACPRGHFRCMNDIDNRALEAAANAD